MTSPHVTFGALALACYLVFMSASVRAQNAGAGAGHQSSRAARDGTIRFDIPAQALRSALDTYGSLTGLGVLVDSSLTQRRTTAVLGEFAPQDALRKMLEGTGLQARYFNAGTLTIQPVPSTPAAAPANGPGTPFTDAADIPGVMAGGNDYRPYIAMVQTRIKRALCLSPHTQPGRYRLLMQFWIDASGGLQRARLIGSTGNDARDAEVGMAMRDLKVDPPPPSMAQPLVILLEQGRPGMSDDCRQLAAQGR